jgi:hypothetical protein
MQSSTQNSNLGMSNLEIIKKEFEDLKGQFIITPSLRIERFISLSQDEYDYYYVTYDGRKLTHSSCVGRIMPLKGLLRDNDYNEIVRLAKLNHFDQTRNLVDSQIHRDELMKLEAADEFIDDVCWDLTEIPK